MDLRHLRYFLAIVDFGTVTAAAAHFRIAQPAISRQLRTLEQDLGVELFTRNGPRLALTAAGRRMVPVASDLITRADRAEQLGQQLADGALSRVSIAAANTTVSEIVAPFVTTLTTDDPFVTVSLMQAEQVRDAVRGNCDLGISVALPPSGGLDWQPLTSVPLRAYTSPTHAWATSGRTSVSVAELLGETLILPVPADPTRTALDIAVSADDCRYGPFEQVPAPRLVQALAASGRGVGVATDLPRFGAHPVFIETADGTPVTLNIHACWDPQHYALDTIRQFVGRLAVFADTHVRLAAWGTSAI